MEQDWTLSIEPHCCAICEVQATDCVDFMDMELVDGREYAEEVMIWLCHEHSPKYSDVYCRFRKKNILFLETMNLLK